MAEWEYRKIDLNQLSRGRDEVDVLCDAGEEGWDLVAILKNSVAYLKRERGEVVTDTAAPSTGAPVREANVAANDACGCGQCPRREGQNRDRRHVVGSRAYGELAQAKTKTRERISKISGVTMLDINRRTTKKA